ncbi:unnamed protein product, partial [Mesorhabditis belari]|uniref:t-SNARE coiled-coil homology domain-containing protein n=1 Tax=Mesorhabditis belari TaxID=2138241 RepID=A0AAF3FGW8_9BILA
MSLNTSHLAEYEQQYSIQTAEVTAQIAAMQRAKPEERPNIVRDTKKMLAQVNDLLDQMELAVRDLPAGSGERSKFEMRVRSYKQDKRQLDGELDKAIQRAREEADRGELFSEEADAQEDQLIANTQRLERTSRKIQDAYRMVVETEEIGVEVLNNLSSQRETIGRSRDRMREADADLGRSSRLLNIMIRRVIQNRLLVLGVAVFLMFVLLFVVWKSI